MIGLRRRKPGSAILDALVPAVAARACYLVLGEGALEQGDEHFAAHRLGHHVAHAEQIGILLPFPLFRAGIDDDRAVGREPLHICSIARTARVSVSSSVEDRRVDRAAGKKKLRLAACPPW